MKKSHIDLDGVSFCLEGKKKQTARSFCTGFEKKNRRRTT